MGFYEVILVTLLAFYIVTSLMMLCFAINEAVNSHGAVGFRKVLYFTFCWPYALFFRVTISNAVR